MNTITDLKPADLEWDCLFLRKALFSRWCRATDKLCIFISKMPISWPNPMFYHLLELSHRDDSNKWSNLRFGQERMQVESIEVNFTHLIWSSVMSRIVKLIIMFAEGSIRHQDEGACNLFPAWQNMNIVKKLNTTLVPKPTKSGRQRIASGTMGEWSHPDKTSGDCAQRWGGVRATSRVQSSWCQVITGSLEDTIPTDQISMQSADEGYEIIFQVRIFAQNKWIQGNR